MPAGGGGGRGGGGVGGGMYDIGIQWMFVLCDNCH